MRRKPRWARVRVMPAKGGLAAFQCVDRRKKYVKVETIFMAHLWNQTESSGEWAFENLERRVLSLPLQRSAPEAAGGAAPEAATRHPVVCVPAPDDAWLLITQPGMEVRVNGNRLHLGVRLLRDKDHIHLGMLRHYFFSTEQLAAVTSCPESERPVFCPRCKLPLITGRPSVQCPACATRHHQDDEKPCWTYAQTCAVCGQPTALDMGFQWTPENL